MQANANFVQPFLSFCQFALPSTGDILFLGRLVVQQNKIAYLGYVCSNKKIIAKGRSDYSWLCHQMPLGMRRWGSLRAFALQ